MENSAADALVIDMVRTVRDRFGIEGLRDLVAQAMRELQRAEQAAAFAIDDGPSATREQSVPEAPVADVADTQAWIAFTGEDDRR
jgi:hypothetical protein